MTDSDNQANNPEISTLRNEVTALKQAFGAKLNQETEQAIRGRREREIGELKSRRRAIATSSLSPQERARRFEAVTDIERQTYARHRAEDSEHRQRQQVPAQQMPVPQEVTEWGKRNSWYFALRQAGSAVADEAEAIHVALNAQGVPLAENLEEVTRRMAEQYPHLVEPAGGEEKNRSAAEDRSWESIPAADREIAMRRLISKGVFGRDKTNAKEQYARAYWKEYGNS